MDIKVKLQNIIEELEFQIEGNHVFLNMKTGEIISVSSEDLRAAEDEEPVDHLPDWQHVAIEAAIDIVENYENYVELPEKYDINEYSLMEDFCYTVDDQRKQNELFFSIKGKGVFRRFKDKIYDLGIEEHWYKFRSDRLKEIAIEWCLENKVNFYE